MPDGIVGLGTAQAASIALPVPPGLLPVTPPGLVAAGSIFEQPQELAHTPILEEGVSEIVDAAVARIAGGSARLGLYQENNAAGIGEVQALVPLYEGYRMAVFTQFGALSNREDARERWTGSMGLGQRWFWEDRQTDGRFIGYNVFLDHELDQTGRRGGIGAELQYDWVSLSSNYYFPLSGWRTAATEENRRERPMEGWDAQIRGNIPCIPYLSMTGSYAWWNRADGNAEDSAPAATWEYGLELSPYSWFSSFVARRFTGENIKDTVLGVTLSWDFTLPWEKRLPVRPAFSSPEKMAEKEGLEKRHQFIRRNNELDLVYSLDEE